MTEAAYLLHQRSLNKDAYNYRESALRGDCGTEKKEKQKNYFVTVKKSRLHLSLGASAKSESQQFI